MQNTFLIQLMKKLNNKEFKELKKFVHSPFHNNRSIVAEYFDILSKYYPEFQSELLNERDIFHKLYPKKKFKEGIIRRLSSFLLEITEEYLAYKSFKTEDFYSSLYMLSEYNVRGLNSLFSKKLNEIEKKYSGFQGDTEEYFLKRFRIEREKNSFYMLTQNDHLASESIINRTSFFVYQTLIMLFKSRISLYINEKNFSSDYSESEFIEFYKRTDLNNYIHHLKKTKNQFYPVLALHYFEMMALLYPDNPKFLIEYETLLNQHINEYTYIEKMNFYTILEAICTLNIEKGKHEYKENLFRAYQQMLRLHLYSFTQEGDFMLKLFRNIVFASLLVKEYDWLENFLKTYSGKLADESRENMLSFSESVLEFEKGNYEKSLKLLSETDFELFHFKIDIKILKLKLFYEMEYIEELYSQIDSFRHFIYKNRFISKRYKDMCSLFINSVHKLVKLKDNPEDFAFDKLLNESLQIQNLLNQEWIVGKINELRKR